MHKFVNMNLIIDGLNITYTIHWTYLCTGPSIEIYLLYLPLVFTKISYYPYEKKL